VAGQIYASPTWAERPGLARLRVGIVKQRDLFPARPMPRPPACPEGVQPFDFERDGDAAACEPQPGWVPPEELRIWTDEEPA